MAKYLWGLVCLALLSSGPAWAGITLEEMQRRQQQIQQNEMSNREARQDLMLEAFAALDKRDFDRTIKLTSKILFEYQMDSRDKARVLCLRGLACYHKGDLAKAKADLDQAVYLNRQEEKAYLIRSAVHEKANRRSEAIADMEAYLRLKPGDRQGEARLRALKAQATQPAPQPAPVRRSATKPAPWVPSASPAPFPVGLVRAAQAAPARFLSGRPARSRSMLSAMPRGRPQRPAASSAWACLKRRAQAIMRNTPPSAVHSAWTGASRPGTLATGTPRAAAEARPTPSSPTPNCCISRRLAAPSMIAASMRAMAGMSTSAQGAWLDFIRQQTGDGGDHGRKGVIANQDAHGRAPSNFLNSGCRFFVQ